LHAPEAVMTPCAASQTTKLPGVPEVQDELAHCPQPGMPIPPLHPPPPQPNVVDPFPVALQLTTLIPAQAMNTPGMHEHLYGEPLQVKPCSTWQFAPHPSPLFVLPSSHCSVPSTTPSPQMTARASPSAATAES